ncbi:MAG: response regulator, partial [Desulfobacterales bacterium]|nr:response regulator [Desulfobacterales bacterium]
AKTILVVDDDKTVRNTVKQYLTRARYKVETAPDGFKAGMKVQEFKPDLVILDIKMAGMDGFEVCRTIKANPTLKNTRVLIMTGFDTPENRERALREGADAYLPKGGDFKALRKDIKALLDQ